MLYRSVKKEYSERERERKRERERARERERGRERIAGLLEEDGHFGSN